MTTLDGSGRRVDLGLGISVRAPGLRGRADVHDVTPTSDTRAPDVDGSGPALAAALARSDVHRIRVITLDVAGAPVPAPDAVRTPTTDEEGLVVEVPDLGPDVAQVLLAVDEAGVVTWNVPVDDAWRPAPTTRGSGDTVRFVVRSTTPPPHERRATRGVIGALGRTVLELLTITVVEAAAPVAVRAAVAEWERRARPTRVRSFAPEDYRTGGGGEVDAAGWRALSGGRCLLFLHGTFSTAAGAFGGLPADVLAVWHAAYAGRVLAFDHPTLGLDPADNAAALADLVPPGLRLDVDVVAHSRGGLVARALAAAGAAGAGPVRVRRVVHVATPNHGTALADPERMGGLLDRVTTLLNLAPEGPVDAVATGLSVVLVVVKAMVRYGMPALPGLVAMDPGGRFLRTLVADRDAGDDGAEHYAVAADYEPSGSLLRLARGPVGNAVVDRVFGRAPNDLVVPTAGVYEGVPGGAFVVDPGRRLVLPASRAVHHSGYFRQADVAAALGGWLTR